jgi:hypothetical protein
MEYLARARPERSRTRPSRVALRQLSHCVAADASDRLASMWVSTKSVGAFLDARHDLGAVNRGFAWSDEFGVLVLAKPTTRRLPQDGSWLELVRWCLVGIHNGGSMQWSRVHRELRSVHEGCTTVVSYSDPSQGHDGALYRACNWRWAPTWHRLRPPPTGNGKWKTKEQQAPKDRWVFDMRADPRRADLLRVNDESLQRRGIPTWKEFRRAALLTA